jgi:hypothetical protein
MNCTFCHEEITATRIHIRDECPACGGDLHICLNCEFYDPHAYRQCRESIREPVQDKEKANYCDFFRITLSGTARTGGKGDAYSKLKDLFKK